MIEMKRRFLLLSAVSILAVAMPGLPHAHTPDRTLPAEQNLPILLPNSLNIGEFDVAQCTSAAEECQEEKAKKKKQKKKRVRRGSFHYDK